MNYLRITLIWLNYWAKWILSKRRFVAITPPFTNKQICYDRVTKKRLIVFVRDCDDWIQLEHIFLNEEFNLDKTVRAHRIQRLHLRLRQSGKTPLIIDLGANIGFASKYFDLVYPLSKILAVEPNADNCRLARMNLPKHVNVVQAGVSSQAGLGRLIATGRNCAFRVLTDGSDGAGAGEEIELITVQDLLHSARDCIPFLIKIDIEGFESDLFSRDVDWIDLFPVLLIELHDWMLPEAHVTRNFLQAIARRNREFMHFDGYIVSLNLPDDNAREQP